LWDKKGDFGFPLYFFQSFVIFIFILIFFSILFFFIGIAENPNLIINADSYSDSSKLLTLLQTPTTIQETKLSIAELIALSYEDPNYKQKLTEELNKLLASFSKPENKQSYWNLEIQNNNIIFLSLGDKTLGAKNYYTQKVTLPTLSKDKVQISLYLNCLGCTKGDIEKYA